MRHLAAVAALFFVSGAAHALAQDAPPPSTAAAVEDQDQADGAARPHIQVLQHPYDISSFYRAQPDGDSRGFGYAPATEGRYPIAGFYRAGAQGRYSMFWTNGYGRGYGRVFGNGRGMRGRGGFAVPRSRALGLNGDLNLFAPTFLSSVGPLTGVFFER
jgi:hypothetical protein